MFKFLKKFFFEEREKEPEKEGIKVDELGDWFKAKSDKIFSELDLKINDMRNSVKENIIKTKDNLAILGTAELHNPKITVREIQFMEGNRKSYILTVNNFLRGIEIGEDYPKILDFCNDFHIRLDKFSKSTIRPYHILQEFFSNESRNIAINIKNLDSSIKELKKAVESADVDGINNVKRGVIELNNKIKQKNEFEGLIKEKNDVKQELIKNKERIEKESNGLRKSKEYEQLNELKANKEAVLASIREHNAKIVHAFSVMERPLKKLQRMVLQDGALLEKYIGNPVVALVNDDNLKIIDLLNKLERNINNLTLELKDRKREKVLETVKGLTGEFLREFVNKHNELNNKLESLENSIEENEVLKKENKLDYELSNVNGNLENINTEILNNEQGLSKINIDEMKNSLSDKINGLLKVDVVIA